MESIEKIDDSKNSINDEESPKLSIIVPVYNGAGFIFSNINEMINEISKTEKSYELIIVNDGSKDETLNELKKITSDNVKIINGCKNTGKGHAIKCGSDCSKGDFIAFIDSDLEIHPKHLPEYLDIIKSNGSDIVIGSKVHPRSKVNYPMKRRVLSYCYYLFVRSLFRLNVKDSQVGLKIFRRDALKKPMSKVLVKRYAFDVELLALAHKMGYKIEEAPVEVNFKFNSNLDFKGIWNMFVDTCAVYYRLKILKYYDIN